MRSVMFGVLRSRSRRRLAVPVAVLSCGIFAAACGGTQPAERQPQEPVGDAAEVGTPPAAPAAPLTSAAPSGESAGARPAELTLQAEHEVGGVQVVMEDLHRASGDTVVARWRYRNESSEDKLLAQGSLSWYDSYRLSGAAYLIDPVNKKKYLVITDAEDRPLASQFRAAFGELILPAGQDTVAWARFPAPPESVETLSVYLPRVPPFEDVPITP